MTNNSNSQAWKSMFRKAIPIVIGGIILGSFYWWGDFNVMKTESRMNVTIQQLTNERDKAINKEELLQDDVKREQDRSLDLEKENRQIRDENRIMKDSINIVTKEINVIKSRVVELGEYDSIELFNNQFLLSVYKIEKDTTAHRAECQRYLYCLLYYIGNERKKLRENNKGAYVDKDYQWHLCIGKSLFLEFRKEFYIVRLLSIDFNNKKAKFSKYTDYRKPGT